MDTIIKIEGLKKSFPIGVLGGEGRKEVLKNINLEIKQGRVYALAGKNGAGKSTLLKIMTNLIQRDSGEVEIFGERITKRSYKYLSKVGVIIEEPKFYDATVMDNLEIYCNQRGIYDKESITSKYNNLQVNECIHKRINELSTGNKQKVAIIRAMLSEPEILILDEPFNYIDTKGIFEAKELILKVKRELNTTVIISTHLLRDVEDLVDELIILDNGEIKEIKSIGEIKKYGDKNIKLKVDNIPKALVVIEKEFGIKEYTVVGSEIYIFSHLNMQNEIIKTLINSNISIESVGQENGSLEKYYLSKIQ